MRALPMPHQMFRAMFHGRTPFRFGSGGVRVSERVVTIERAYSRIPAPGIRPFKAGVVVKKSAVAKVRLVGASRGFQVKLAKAPVVFPHVRKPRLSSGGPNHGSARDLPGGRVVVDQGHRD